MSNLPMVSIVIPVFNGSDYLASAIDSALAQDYQNIEVIVINDGSLDNGATETIAKGYGDRVRYFSKENGGVASALNLGINVMSGEYFSWLSHDDLYEPFKISHQVSLLRKHGFGKFVAYGAACVFGKNPDICKPIPFYNVSPEDFKIFLATNNSLHGCTLLIPKAAFMEVGVFNTKLKTTQDYDMWFRLTSTYKFIGSPTSIVKARQHDAQGTVTMKETVLRECDELVCRFLDELPLNEPGHTPPKKPDTYIYLAKTCYRRGLIGAARRALSKSTRASRILRLAVRVQGEGLFLLRIIRTRILK